MNAHEAKPLNEDVPILSNDDHLQRTLSITNNIRQHLANFISNHGDDVTASPEHYNAFCQLNTTILDATSALRYASENITIDDLQKKNEKLAEQNANLGEENNALREQLKDDASSKTLSPHGTVRLGSAGISVNGMDASLARRTAEELIRWADIQEGIDTPSSHDAVTYMPSDTSLAAANHEIEILNGKLHEANQRADKAEQHAVDLKRELRLAETQASYDV